MEKNGKEIITEVMNSLAALTERVRRLEMEVAALKEPIDLDWEAVPESIESQDIPIPVEVLEPAGSPFSPEETGEEDLPAPSEAPVPEMEPAEAPATVSAEAPESRAVPVVEPESPAEALESPALPVVEDLPLASDIPAPEAGTPEAAEPPSDLFGTDAPPRPVTLNESKAGRKPRVVLDVMAGKMAWKTDIPGPPVKDIRSAISLNDRVLFINSLFRQDAMLFQDTVTRIGAMPSLDAVCAYLAETFPEWKMNSDEVYRFMMAVRRKIR